MDSTSALSIRNIIDMFTTESKLYFQLEIIVLATSCRTYEITLLSR